MPRPPPGVRLAGLSVHDGIILVGRRAWAAAQAMPDGSVRTFSAPLRPPPELARLPLVRAWTGPLRQAAATKAALAAMHGRPAPRRWMGVLVLLAVQAFLAGAGIYLGIQAARMGRPLHPAATAALGCAALFLYMLLAAALGSLHPRLRRMHRFHGAEHRVIHALESDSGGFAAWRGRQAACPKEHTRCGTGWTFVLLAVPFTLGACLWPLAPDAVGHPGFALAWMLLGPALLSELSAFRPLEAVLAAPGLALQRFTTREPTEREAEVAEAAAAVLLGASGVPSG